MVNIGSAYGLLPDGTKPSPEPMLTDHQWSPMTFISGQFQKRCSITKICLKMTYLISFRGQRVNIYRHYAKYVIISNQTYQADITMSSKIAIQWTSRRRKSPATWLLVQQLVQANNKGTTKAPHYWSFFRVNHRCIPLTKPSNTESVSMPWRHHVYLRHMEALPAISDQRRSSQVDAAPPWPLSLRNSRHRPCNRTIL